MSNLSDHLEVHSGTAMTWAQYAEQSSVPQSGNERLDPVRVGRGKGIRVRKGVRHEVSVSACQIFFLDCTRWVSYYRRWYALTWVLQVLHREAEICAGANCARSSL